MRWSKTDNRWDHDTYKCCDREFRAHGAYMQHVNYDHGKSSKKNFPRGMQTASQLLLLGFLAAHLR